MSSDERGFTIIEVLVAMSVGMIVMIGVLNIVDAAGSALGRTQSRVDAQARGRNALEQAVGDLRNAVCVQTGGTLANPTLSSPLVSADRHQVTLYVQALDRTQVNSGTFAAPSKLQLAWSGGTLTESIWPGSGSPPAFANTAATRTVATGLDERSDRPVFSYFAWLGSPAALTDITPAAGGQLTAAQLPTVTRVDVAFSANPTTPNAPAGTNALFDDSVAFRVPTDFTSDTTAQVGPVCQL